MIPIVVALINGLHDLFVAIWIGGMSVLAFIIIPTLKLTIQDKKLRKVTMNKIQKKLGCWAYTSMIMLIVTGILMTQRTEGLNMLFSFQNTYASILSIKHILTIIMILISLTRQLWMEKLVANPQQRDKVSYILLLTNVTFGYIILFLSAYLPLI